MNENEEKVIETNNNQDSGIVQVPIQENIVVTPTVESDNLSDKLSQENQNIASQQEVIQQQIIDEKAQQEAERKKKEEELLASEANKGPSKFAKFMTVILFVFLFAFVYFLGDITEYINQRKLEKQTAEISNGKLICTNTKSTENLDIKINATFAFENKEIISLNYIITSTGDKIRDKQELEELLSNCKRLQQEVKNYAGVGVVCSLNNGVNSVKQNFDYSVLDFQKMTSAYAEAGGIYPQFKYKDNINSVESKMIASDYSCEKISR